MLIYLKAESMNILSFVPGFKNNVNWQCKFHVYIWSCLEIVIYLVSQDEKIFLLRKFYDIFNVVPSKYLT